MEFAAYLLSRHVDEVMYPEVEVMTFTRGVEEIFWGKISVIEMNTCKKC